MQAPPDSLFLVIVINDHVLRAGESYSAIHHNQFPVIAEIGSAPMSSQRLQWQHGPMLRSHVGEPADRLFAIRVHELRDVIGQYADLNASPASSLQSIEERRRGLILDQDEEFDMYVCVCLIDCVGHLLDRTLVVVDQLR